MKSQILISPIITEKSMEKAAGNWYTFAVSKWARKEEIKKEVNKAYKVKVLQVRTITKKGKTKKVGRRQKEVFLGNGKKALVLLPKEQKIEAFSAQK